ncbi:MAG TPA: hypothetical protein VJ302_21010, partial [Blastocatellia bacterium]|nr:hypothetical protein [Blastocatellia bacterium]
MEKTRAKTNVKTKKSEGAARQNQVIAVVIKQYATGLYRACVSLHRDDVTFLSSHKDERSANETINLFWRAYDEGRLQTREDLATFINVIQRRNAAPTDPQPVPPLPPRPAVSSIPPAAPRPAMPQRPAVSSMPPRVQMPPTSPV